MDLLEKAQINMFKRNIRDSLKPFINFQWKIHEFFFEKLFEDGRKTRGKDKNVWVPTLA